MPETIEAKTRKNTQRKIQGDWRFAEFFAGIGLVRIGLEQSNPRWTCAFDEIE